jgi:ATP-dependent Clp protease ATP-binding subunit ClpA
LRADKDVAVPEPPPHRTALDGLSPAARLAVAAAEREADSSGLGRLGTEHLLLGLLATSGSIGAGALEAAGVRAAATQRKVAEAVNQSTRRPEASSPGQPRVWSPRAERALGRAFRFSKEHRAPAATSAHLLLGVLDVEGTAGQVLRGLGTDVDGLRASLLRRASDADAEVGDAAAAASPEATAAEPPAVALRCPGCTEPVAGRLVHEVTGSRGARGEREVVVFACGGCGTVLGVSPMPVPVPVARPAG